MQVRQRSVGDTSDSESIEIVSLFGTENGDFDVPGTNPSKSTKSTVGGLIGLHYTKKGLTSTIPTLSNRPNLYQSFALSGQTLENLAMEKTPSWASITSICTLDHEKLRLSGQSPDSFIFWPHTNSQSDYHSDQFDEDLISVLDPLILSRAWSSPDKNQSPNTPKATRQEIPPLHEEDDNEPSLQELLRFLLQYGEESINSLIFDKLGFVQSTKSQPSLKPNIIRLLGYLVLGGLGGYILYKARQDVFNVVQQY